MTCPSSLEPTPITSPKRFTNWARKLTFTAANAYRPTLRGEIVAIIQRAEAEGLRVKWTGSLWSFTESFVTNDIIIESEGITGDIPADLILEQLDLRDPIEDLVHVKGGTKIYNLNRILHGLPPASNGGGADETNLPCGDKAMPTLGGSGGQSIAGLLATGSHGGDVDRTPMADAVAAIHLIGPGGQEWWLERSSRSLTTGDAEATQATLRAISESSEAAAAEICADVRVVKDDDFFHSVLVSVGRMGFVYALVFRTVDSFKLNETRRNDIWETLKNDLTAANFRTYLDGQALDRTPLHFLQILINPFRNRRNQHDCKVAHRHEADCEAENVETGGGLDVMGFICRRQDARIFIPVLAGIVAGLSAAVTGLLATATALAAIPFVGWALAAASYAAAGAAGAAATALTGIIGFLTVSGRVTTGQLVARIANFAYAYRMKDLMRIVLGLLFDSAYPLTPSRGVSWKIMDTYGYEGEDFCQKVESMDIAFDVARASIDARGTHTGYLGFLEEVFSIFDDLFRRNQAVAGLLALRFTGGTAAKLGMSRFAQTCHIEIPILQDFGGNEEFIRRVHQAAIRCDGVPHWGQDMRGFNARNIRDLYGDDLIVWRQTLRSLIREGGGRDFTFSNNFTSFYNLEPLEDTVVRTIVADVTVGADPLGDTDWLRPQVSEDFLFVRLRSGDEVEIGLNQGETWHAHTQHQRRIELPDDLIWSDINAVGIRHVAAGNDWNADNWGMDKIVISSIDDTGTTTQRLLLEGNPIYYFQKNSNNIWEHFF